MTGLSVIVPWRDRPELADTLASNAAAFSAVGAEVIVVNCGGTRELLAGRLSAPEGGSLRWADISAPEFNKGRALNLGASLSDRRALFLLDADILIEPETMVQAESALDEESFVTIAEVIESRSAGLGKPPPSAVESVTHIVEFAGGTGEAHRIVTNRLHLGLGTRAGPGLTLVSRASFLAVGGMNSDLTGWGWDDLDLIARLQMSLGLRRREVGRVTHMSHGDEVRTLSGETRAASESRNFMQCLAVYSVGELRGTYEADVVRASPGMRVSDL